MLIASPASLVGVVHGMIVWAVWFVVVYAVTAVGCDAGWHARAVPGGNLLGLAQSTSTLVALLLISVCATRGYRAWRRVERDGTGIEARQRARFLGLLMFVLSLLAIVGTVMIAIPMLLLDPCAA